MPITFPPLAMPLPVLIGPTSLVPMVGQYVHAGLPSPADDFIEEMIDLNSVLIQNPAATFLWRVFGDWPKCRPMRRPERAWSRRAELRPRDHGADVDRHL